MSCLNGAVLVRPWGPLVAVMLVSCADFSLRGGEHPFDDARPQKKATPCGERACDVPTTEPASPLPSAPWVAEPRRIAATTNSLNRLAVFWMGPGGGIMHTFQVFNGWSVATSFGGSARDLAVAKDESGRMQLLYVGTDDRLYHRAQTSPFTWSDEQAVGVMARRVALGRAGDGRLHAFYIDPGGAISHLAQAIAGGPWGAPERLGAHANDIAIGTQADGRIDRVAVPGDEEPGGRAHSGAVRPGRRGAVAEREREGGAARVDQRVEGDPEGRGVLERLDPQLDQVGGVVGVGLVRRVGEGPAGR